MSKLKREYKDCEGYQEGINRSGKIQGKNGVRNKGREYFKRFLEKLKIELHYNPKNCTTRNLSKGYKNADLKGHAHPNVYSRTINNSQSMERAQMSIN